MEKQEKVFKKLKKRFTKELVLAASDLDKKIRIEVNTSGYVMGGILSMECEDGKWRPVAYLSKYLIETKRNYEIDNKKILVMIRALEN